MMSDSQAYQTTKNIKIAFFLNLLFTLLEIIGGLWTNSVAILSDALHDLGDSIALGSSWYLAKISEKSRDNKFSYGYRRFSLLSAFINALILLVGSIFILQEAIPRLIYPEPVRAEGMILLAIIGVILNGAAVLKLYRGKTQNEKVVALHLLEDVLGWIAVLIASIIMLFFNIPILDPILSVGITIFISWHVISSLWETSHIFLQAIPGDIKTEQLAEKLTEALPIHSIHDLCVWTMDGEYHVLSLHIVVKDNTSSAQLAEIKKEIRNILKKYNIYHSTVEIEYESEYCELRCG